MSDAKRDPPPSDARRSGPLAGFRREYKDEGLLESLADADPFVEFDRWFDAAVAAGVREPNAMTLATASAAGVPSARVVLLKGVDRRGFVFFTNYESAKGRDLAENPRAALVLFWAELERQVRVQGAVGPIAAAESDDYFRGRPLGSRLGAWASRQSTPVESRADLEAALHATEARYASGDVPRPPHWGGYRVVPERIEFWQGRANRMHDRLLYVRDATAEEGAPGASRWTRTRLSP
jgi:pyridoxamine 5'-phosphate oxidase